MKYAVKELHKIFDDLYDAINEIIADNNNAIFDDVLDECEESIRIFDYEYNVSRVIKTIDPIAYRCALSDFVDNEAFSMLCDFETENVIDYYGYTIRKISEY